MKTLAAALLIALAAASCGNAREQERPLPATPPVPTIENPAERAERKAEEFGEIAQDLEDVDAITGETIPDEVMVEVMVCLDAYLVGVPAAEAADATLVRTLTEFDAAGVIPTGPEYERLRTAVAELAEEQERLRLFQAAKPDVVHITSVHIVRVAEARYAETMAAWSAGMSAAIDDLDRPRPAGADLLFLLSGLSAEYAEALAPLPRGSLDLKGPVRNFVYRAWSEGPRLGVAGRRGSCLWLIR